MSLAAEYPNDNPALHCGAIWVCRSVTGPAEAEVPELVVEELEPLDAAVPIEGSCPPPAPAASGILPIVSSALPPPPSDAFVTFVCVLTDVAVSAGSPVVAALLPRLLLEGRVGDVDEATARLLRGAGIWDGAAITPGFAAVAAGWREILRGTSDDFAACGGTMLDQWAADLLGALLGGRGNALRAELRGRGVAAFGLAAAA